MQRINLFSYTEKALKHSSELNKFYEKVKEGKKTGLMKWQLPHHSPPTDKRNQEQQEIIYCCRMMASGCGQEIVSQPETCHQKALVVTKKMQTITHNNQQGKKKNLSLNNQDSQLGTEII